MKNNIKKVYQKKLIDKEKVKNQVLLKRKELNKMNEKNKKLAYIGGTLIIVLVITFSLIGITKNKTVKVNYREYMTANQKLNLEKSSLKEKINKLHDNYMANEISEEDYFSELESLKEEYNKVLEEKKQLKKDYNLEEKDLTKLTFSNNKEEDKKLKEIHQKEILLESEEDELDALEDDLEKRYKNKEITKEEYLQQKISIDQKEDELDDQEEELDALEDALDIDDNDDDEEPE